MPLVRQRVQRIKDPAAAAERVVLAKAQFFRQTIRRFEADPPNIVRQTVGIFLDCRNAFISVSFINFGRKGRADIIALKKQHDILDFFLLLPAFLNHLDPLFPNSGDLQQPVCSFFDHRQRIRAEQLNDPFGKARANALDQTAAQIFFNAVNGSRQGLFPLFRAELIPVSGIHFPLALEQQDRPNVYVQQVSNHRH